MPLEEDFRTLRWVAEGRTPDALKSGSLANLIAEGMIEKQLGTWKLTSRGHAALLRHLVGYPNEAA